MKTRLLLILIIIFFTIEFRSNSFKRKLYEDSTEIDMTETKIEVEEYKILLHINDTLSDTLPTEEYKIPRHPNNTLSDTLPPDIISSNQGDTTIEDTTKEANIPRHPHSSL